LQVIQLISVEFPALFCREFGDSPDGLKYCELFCSYSVLDSFILPDSVDWPAMELSSHYAQASIKTADPLRTLAQFVLIRDVSGLSLLQLMHFRRRAIQAGPWHACGSELQ
jgi:hypothetical protein